MAIAPIAPRITGAGNTPTAYGIAFAQADDTARRAALGALGENQAQPLADYLEARRQYAPTGSSSEAIKTAALSAAGDTIRRYDTNQDGRLDAGEFQASMGLPLMTASPDTATGFALQWIKSAIASMTQTVQTLSAKSGLSSTAADDSAPHLLPINDMLDGTALRDQLAKELQGTAAQDLTQHAQHLFESLDVHHQGSLGANDLAAATLLQDDLATPLKQALKAHPEALPPDRVQALTTQVALLEKLGKTLNGVIEPIAEPLMTLLRLQELNPDPDKADANRPINLLQAALAQVHALFFEAPNASSSPDAVPAPTEPVAA